MCIRDSFITFRIKNFYQATALIIIGFLLQSAVFHPWYAIWFLPFLCFWKNPAAIFLSVAVLFSYQAGVMLEDKVNIYLKTFIFGGFFAIAIYSLFAQQKFFNLLQRRAK